MALKTVRSMCTQLFPPSPVLTEQNVAAQTGRVFIVTGGNGGVGLALCRILYGTGATIYMASRSKERAEEAIRSITGSSPTPANPGRILFLQLDLNDLESVKAAAATFAALETKLDVLWNNAGMGANRIAPGTRTKQGFEAMVGMHCIATLLFTDLLRPQLRAAAASQPAGAVRVVWTSSLLAESGSPVNGVDFATLAKGSDDRVVNYAVSKAGTWMLAREMARRYAADGILSIVQNPGNLKAGSYEGTPALTMCLVRPLLHDARFGAYTELYCGLSPDITAETNGAYVIPWGRVRPDQDCPRADLVSAMAPVEEGGLGYPTKLWDWCEEQWRPFIETPAPSGESAHI